MKASSLVLVGALLLFIQSAGACATGIYQVSYKYSFDSIARDSAHRETFVICEHACVTAPYPVPAIRLPGLSVRASEDLALGMESTQKGLVGTKSEITTKEIAP